MGEERIRIRVERILEDLIPGFLEHRRSDVLSIREALGTGNYETIRILGHGMKGIGASYGFNGISEIGQAIEAAAVARRGDEIKALADDLASYLMNVDVEYED